MGDCCRMGCTPLRVRSTALLPVAVAMPGSSSYDTALQLLPGIPDTCIQWVIRSTTGDMDRQRTDYPAEYKRSESVFAEAE